MHVHRGYGGPIGCASCTSYYWVTMSMRPTLYVCYAPSRCGRYFPSCYQHGVDYENKNASWYSRLFLSKNDLMFSGHTCFFMFCGSTVRSRWLDNEVPDAMDIGDRTIPLYHRHHRCHDRLPCNSLLLKYCGWLK
jgi:hypothetical protein